jgi:hypothetical protein
MTINISESGNFELIIDSSQLSRGLRPSKRMPRDSGYLVKCEGAVGLDGVLQTIEELREIDTLVITDVFPFPQIFVFTNFIIVCGPTTIYELVAGSLVSKLGDLANGWASQWGISPWGQFLWPGVALPIGSTWTAVDFFDYIYLSNGKVAVKRDATSGVYSVSTTLPTAIAICNFRGQVLIGTPSVVMPVVNLIVNADPVTLTITPSGDYA